MKIQIDISGRISERNKHSILSLASVSDSSKCYSVFLHTRLKKEILRKFGKITDCIEKLHCILIYCCLKNFIQTADIIISEIQICNDCGKAKILKYLSDYLRDYSFYKRAKVYVKAVGKASTVHKYLVQVRKERRLADIKISKRRITEMIK